MWILADTLRCGDARLRLAVATTTVAKAQTIDLFETFTARAADTSCECLVYGTQSRAHSVRHRRRRRCVCEVPRTSRTCRWTFSKNLKEVVDVDTFLKHPHFPKAEGVELQQALQPVDDDSHSPLAMAREKAPQTRRTAAGGTLPMRAPPPSSVQASKRQRRSAGAPAAHQPQPRASLSLVEQTPAGGQQALHGHDAGKTPVTDGTGAAELAAMYSQ